MRNLPPDVFEVRLRHNNYDDRTVIEVWSRMYDIRLGFALRREWGDPRRLAEWVERFVGGTVQSWHASSVGAGSGREMAQALMPHWEREIHRAMEHFERMDRDLDRNRRAMYDYVAGVTMPNYWFDEWGGITRSRPEDPKAKEKARQLLMRNLDDGQLKSFKKDGCFRVTAQDGKVYTISTARSFNVKSEDETKYCGQLADTPVEDQMLAQKLLLEHEPEKFFKNANISPAIAGVDAGAGFIQSGTGATRFAWSDALRPGDWNI